MLNSLPKISVIMPAFNRARFIAEAMKSALTQSFKEFELIVIDDGSTDGTFKIAEDIAASDGRVRAYRNERNLGIAKTRNRGLELARAEYIAILDSDDIWLDPDKLQRQTAYLDAHPECALVGGNIIHIDQNGRQLKKVIWPTTDEAIRKIILRYNPFAQSTLMYRKSVVIGCGGYDSAYMVSDDYNLWLCMGTKYKFANLPYFLTGYRIHGGNITRTKRLTTAREILEIVRAHREDYPGASIGIAKAYLRLILAYLRT